MTRAMASPDTTVLLAGATGLVGGACLAALAARPSIERIVPVGRRAPSASDPRVVPTIVDFAALAGAPPVPAKVALCALGTTIKKAGSEAAFRAIDLDAVVAFARWAKEGGATVFGLVSSVGAGGGNFYLRVKGEAEDAVAALGFASFVALRPGMLLGARTESRPGESIGQALLPAVNPLLFGSARKYRAIEAGQVAAALASLAVGAPPVGRVVWHYDEILAAGTPGPVARA